MLNKLYFSIIVILSLLCLNYYIGFNKYKDKSIELRNNINANTKEWLDKENRLVNTTKELNFNISDLRNIIKKDSSDLNEFDIRLLKAKKEIDNLNLKLKNVESVTSTTIETSSSHSTTISIDTINKDSLYYNIKPIKTKFLEITFKYDINKDSLYVNHLYKNDITIIVDRETDKFTVNNKKRFFIARWFDPRWIYKSNIVTEDKNARIISHVKMNFHKR